MANRKATRIELEEILNLIGHFFAIEDSTLEERERLLTFLMERFSPEEREKDTMAINKIVTSAQFLVDADGNQTAVQLDIASWNALLEAIEDLEDIAEIEKARREIATGEDKLISWEEIEAAYLTASDV